MCTHPCDSLVKHYNITHMGECKHNHTILDLSTRWRWVVSITPQLLYLWGKSLQYQLDKTLVEPKSQSGHCEVEKNLLPQPSSPQPVTIPTELIPFISSHHSAGQLLQLHSNFIQCFKGVSIRSEQCSVMIKIHRCLKIISVACSMCLTYWPHFILYCWNVFCHGG
jgi:hypothetical protein